jgi:DNA-binding LacI/PurR family transcriptional regulator
MGGSLAAKHLMDLGHKKIGYIDRHIDHSHSIGRRTGFTEAMSKNNLKIKDEHMIRGRGLGYEDGYQAILQLLKSKEEPTAVFVINDVTAFGTIRAVFDSGLKVPEDISIIGYDDMEFGKYTIPRLTTIHYPVIEVAEASSELILSRIGKDDLEEFQKIVIEPGLIIRESTAKPKN